MNNILKINKIHQKTTSRLNSNSKNKPIISSSTLFKPKFLYMNRNMISTSFKKTVFTKDKKLLKNKNCSKTNKSNNNQRNSNKNMFSKDKYTNKEESKGDNDDTSTNNLTTKGLNNEPNLNATFFKRAILTSSKNINYKELNSSMRKKYLNKNIYNTFNSINNKNNFFNNKYNFEVQSICKSQSNKEIKNIENEIIQRCRHKQVKREMYKNTNSINKNKINEKNKNINNNLNIVKKRKKNIFKIDKSVEYEKDKNKLLNKTSIINKKEKNKNNSILLNKRIKNKNYFKKNSKKQLSSFELYSLKNKSYKTQKNTFINDIFNLNIKLNKENYNYNNKNIKNNFERKNLDYFKSLTIKGKIKKIKLFFIDYNNINNEKKESNDNLNNINNLSQLNNSCINKYKYYKLKSNDNVCIYNYKSINKFYTEKKTLKKINKNNNFNFKNNKKLNKENKINKKKINKNNNHNNDKKLKDIDICLDEDELDENMLTSSKNKNKYIGNKKCQTIINKVLCFDAGSREIFNNYKINNDINDINSDNFFNKNKSTKSMENKKNSCNSIINSNFEENHKGSNNNININNINIIIKNNIDYILNKKNNLKNKILFKKYNTNEVLDNYIIEETTNIPKNNIDNYKLFLNQEDRNNNSTMNQEYILTENNTNSIELNKDKYYYNNKKIMSKKKIICLNYKKKRLLYKAFNCDNFKKNLFSFSDINTLNKICLLSKKIYIFMKPLIYNKINSFIYDPNKINKNLKIKKYLMEKCSPLSKLSPALILKIYTDLKFENNHIYDTEIKKDLTRTFPDNILFKYGNNYYNKLYHILTAFSNYNKNIGYTQGLNFLAAHIIYFFDEEIEEFIFLDALIHRFDLEEILCPSNNNFFIKKLDEINNYIKKKLPKLSNHLNEMKLNYEFFTTNWVLTLFSNSMETKYLFYIWDYMIIFGWKFVKCFVVAVFMNFEKDILNATQNNLTFIMKNMIKNNQFNNNFKDIISITIQMLIKENDII